MSLRFSSAIAAIAVLGTITALAVGTRALFQAAYEYDEVPFTLMEHYSFLLATASMLFVMGVGLWYLREVAKALGKTVPYERVMLLLIALVVTVSTVITISFVWDGAGHFGGPPIFYVPLAALFVLVLAWTYTIRTLLALNRPR